MVLKFLIPFSLSNELPRNIKSLDKVHEIIAQTSEYAYVCVEKVYIKDSYMYIHM